MGGNNTSEEQIDTQRCNPPTMHLSGKQFYCDRDNCKNRICEKCIADTGPQGQRYCLTCAISMANYSD